MTKVPFDWVVDPYIAVGPIRFGMSPQDVAAILGPADDIQKREPMPGQPKKRGAGQPFAEFRQEPGAVRLRRDVPVVHYEDGKVAMLDFLKSAKSLRWGDTVLFEGTRQAVIDRLVAQSTTVFESFEGFLFIDTWLVMMSAENARGSVDSGDWNIGVYGDPGMFDQAIREDLEHDMGRYLKGEPAA